MKPAVAFRCIPKVLFKDQRWYDCHQNGDHDHNRGINPGKPVNEFFLFCFIFLGFRDHGDDSLNGGVGSQMADTHLEHALPVDRA